LEGQLFDAPCRGMAENWLRRTDTLDTLRLDNTILTGVASHNGLTLYQANLQYPVLTTSNSVISGPSLSTTVSIGNLNPTPQYINATSTLDVQSNNPTQPVSGVKLTIQDTSGQASLLSVIIGNGSDGFGGAPNDANRAYRYIYTKSGMIQKVEHIQYVPVINGGTAGVSELPGDISFYFNMQVAQNILAGGKIVANQNDANRVGLYGSGKATIGGGGSVVVPFVGLTVNARILATPTGAVATLVSVIAGVGSFTIYGTAGTVVNWMVIYN